MYFHYGDWVPPPPYPGTNQSLTSVAAYAVDVENLAKLAGVLGNNGDQQKYMALFTEIGEGFHKAFYNSSIQSYVGRTLTANVMAVAINAVPASLKATIMNEIIKIIRGAGNHSICGILGARWLFPVLSNNGHHDIALQIATQTTYPSLGYMFHNPYENATSLWELLNTPESGPGMNSRNHPMWGSIGSWFYRYIGGIKPNALEEIEISPAPVGANSPVNSATVSYNSMKGLISVNWTKTLKSFGMNVVIPSATTARVIVPHHESPYANLKVGGEMMVDFTEPSEMFEGSIPGVRFIRLREDGSIELNVQPGEYSLDASI
jgi:alpha-L-rhamnosidase